MCIDHGCKNIEMATSHVFGADPFLQPVLLVFPMGRDTFFQFFLGVVHRFACRYHVGVLPVLSARVGVLSSTSGRMDGKLGSNNNMLCWVKSPGEKARGVAGWPVSWTGTLSTTAQYIR